MKSIDVNVLRRKLLVARDYYFYDIFVKQFLFSVLSLMSLIFIPKLFAKIVCFTFSQDKPLPIGNERMIESPSVFDDFLVKISGIKKIDEINIVMKGKSLDKYKGTIDFSLPTFYINGLLDFTSSPFKGNTTIFYGNKESGHKQNSFNIINVALKFVAR